MSLPEPKGRQREVVFLPEKGHVVVLGTAGSGKTTMAVLRANYLAQRFQSKVLLVTFNNALVTYLKTLAAQHQISDLLEFQTFHHFARGYLNSVGQMRNNAIAGPDEREFFINQVLSVIRQTHGAMALLDRPVSFFAEECKWIAGCGIRTAEEYASLRPDLAQGDYDVLLLIHEGYKSLRSESGFLYDWDDLADQVEQSFISDQRPRRYQHVVIDEGQDFTPTMLRSLVQAISANGSLTFFGDMAQQIYGNRISWRTAGLKPQAVLEFREDYRNTRQIAALSLALTKTPAFGGVADMVAPNNPKADGPLPAIVHCASFDVERQLIIAQAKSLSAQQSVAILVRKREQESYYLSMLPGVQRLHRDLSNWSPTGISVGTYHAAKGFEFDTVIMPYCDLNTIPDPQRLLAFTDPSEAIAQEARLLYVAITRARVRLIVTHVEPLTPLLPDNIALYQWVER